MRFEIPTAHSPFIFELSEGQSAVLIGANGAGKTRLGVYLETQFSNQSNEVHRIGAHRSLTMNTKMEVVDFQRAENFFRTGTAEGLLGYRIGNRWQNQPATALLTDFDHLVRALYSEEHKISSAHLRQHRRDLSTQPPETKLDKVKRVWDAVLPHRELVLLAADLKVRSTSASGAEYDAGQMSDGERVIFYLIAQCMMVRPGCAVIVDEPELHIHKAILSKVWDAIESERSDCSFLYLTHDLEFATSRRGAKKIVVVSFDIASSTWDVASLPESMELPEDIVAKIVGSRLPILFVEGNDSSLDLAVYRRVYTEHTVLAIGSCDEVIHAVATFNRHPALHRVGCAGLIDADGRDTALADALASRQIQMLPVSEIENLFALPATFTQLAKLAQFNAGETDQLLAQLKTAVINRATQRLDSWAVAAAKRRIDRSLKRIGLDAKNKANLATEFASAISQINPSTICEDQRAALQSALQSGDLSNILRL
ncbi:MAG TPA: AAA family ATPase, partial [Pseudolabrys sp.]|nr:AAA family ATPase [Pseudolabrys sp.]